MGGECILGVRGGGEKEKGGKKDRGIFELSGRRDVIWNIPQWNVSYKM